MMEAGMNPKVLHAVLERIYRTYHRREFIPPDPLMFVHRYRKVEDREVAALVASSFALGRVEQIARCLERIFSWMGPHPGSFLAAVRDEDIFRFSRGFKYRFIGETEFRGLICGIRRVLKSHGSLQACFGACYEACKGRLLDALDAFVWELGRSADGTCFEAGRLLARPKKGSACKRLHLFLRWMVRRDAVDPGGWTCILPGDLIVPLDTHMFRLGRLLGFTRRKQCDAKAALEVTRGFAEVCPGDPVRYDFSLTRLSMREKPALEFRLELTDHESFPEGGEVCR